MTRKSSKRSTSKTTRLSRAGGWLRRHLAGGGRRIGRALGWVVILSIVVVGAAASLKAMEKFLRIKRASAAPIQYYLELRELPAWMPQTLARLVLADMTPSHTPYEDPDLCRKVHEAAKANPWVAEVLEVRRVRLEDHRAVVRVWARYRQPIARVAWRGRSYFVDAESYVLPYNQTPRWAAQDADGVRYYLHQDSVPRNLRGLPIHYMVVEGVQAAPPSVGRHWAGDDLTAGLRLVQLINTRTYANQITVVDVRNHAKRISESDPELYLYAQQGRCRPTEIRFGRFPYSDGGDWVISPDRKMKYLDDYVVDQNGRLAGVHSYIDVRFDELRVSLN
jgi:hypothetical protein